MHHRASRESQSVYLSLVRLACHHPPLGRYFFFSALSSTEMSMKNLFHWLMNMKLFSTFLCPFPSSRPIILSFQVLGIPHPRYHAVAYATAVEALKEKLQTMEPSTVTTGFRDRVTKAWQAVRDAGATMIPAKVRMLR